jgi:hypothetical protein
VLRQADHYKYENGTIYYRKDIEDNFKLIVPPKEAREEIILSAHLLGHFQVKSTYERLKETYYWKRMQEDIKSIIDKCLPCIRHQLKPDITHPAHSLDVESIFSRVGMDLVLDLPST